jgi:hypothetical protein
LAYFTMPFLGISSITPDALLAQGVAQSSHDLETLVRAARWKSAP